MLVNPPTVEVRDEGASLGEARALDFTGAGVGASLNGDVATINVTGGGQGAGNFLSASLDFGPATGEEFDAVTTVTGQSWVTANSVVVATVGGETTDHDSPEDAMVEQINVAIGNRVAGVGFDVLASAPNGTWGVYKVFVTGA